MKEQNTSPSYYAIVPANVRYDKKLKANAKLLYGEITSLCNVKGYCYAKNQYFANLYGVSKGTISKWVSQLVDAGYVSCELIHDSVTKEVTDRYLRITPPMVKNDHTPSQKNQYPIVKKNNTPMVKNDQVNNTSINNTSINKEKNYKKKRVSFIPPELNEVQNYFFEKTKEKEFSKIQGENFWNFYDSKNWFVGRNKMQRWKSAVSGWINRKKEEQEKEKSSGKKEKRFVTNR